MRIQAAFSLIALCMLTIAAAQNYGSSPQKGSMSSILHECMLVNGPRLNKEVLEFLEVISKECPSPNTQTQSPTSLHIYFRMYRTCVHNADTNVLYQKQYESVLECAEKQVETAIKQGIQDSINV